MLLSPHFKNSILGGLGIIITTLLSIYELEGFKGTAKCSLMTYVHPPLPRHGTHISLALFNQTKLLFSCVSIVF